jgi:hypothetical protein
LWKKRFVLLDLTKTVASSLQKTLPSTSEHTNIIMTEATKQQPKALYIHSATKRLLESTSQSVAHESNE